MELLKKFYYGDLNPSEESYQQQPEYKQLLSRINELNDQIKAGLPEADAELLMRLTDSYSDWACMAQEQGFLRGFELGAQFMSELLASGQSASA